MSFFCINIKIVPFADGYYITSNILFDVRVQESHTLQKYRNRMAWNMDKIINHHLTAFR